MQSKTLFRFFTFFVSVLLIIVACTELDDTSVFAPLETTNYEANVKAILQNQCANCHSGTNPAGSYDLENFIGIFGTGTDAVPNAAPGNANSLLLETITSGGSMIDYIGASGNAEVIRAWIVTEELGFANLNAHPSDWMDPGDQQDFHGAHIRENGWDMESCKGCHGVNYDGGAAGSSCLTCHDYTPESCNTCHGRNFRASGLPPGDVDGNVSTTFRGVGAHQIHLSGGIYCGPVECSECHIVPSSVSSTGHIDSTPNAELSWGPLAVNGGASPEFTDDLTCKNTYCHGYFASGQKLNAPKWTVVNGRQSACGTCHKLPPDGPSQNYEFVHTYDHFRCATCHGAVIDENFNIIDKSRHINGIIDGAR